MDVRDRVGRENRVASNPTWPAFARGTIGVSRCNLFTPLQKWEFDNGLPVDGVGDVKKWVVEVGLVGGENEE
ncbi:hypothetical protein KC19_VG053300, partial [Ceratodon purpureus]